MILLESKTILVQKNKCKQMFMVSSNLVGLSKDGGSSKSSESLQPRTRARQGYDRVSALMAYYNSRRRHRLLSPLLDSIKQIWRRFSKENRQRFAPVFRPNSHFNNKRGLPNKNSKSDCLLAFQVAFSSSFFSAIELRPTKRVEFVVQKQKSLSF